MGEDFYRKRGREVATSFREMKEEEEDQRGEEISTKKTTEEGGGGKERDINCSKGKELRFSIYMTDGKRELQVPGCEVLKKNGLVHTLMERKGNGSY